MFSMIDKSFCDLVKSERSSFDRQHIKLTYITHFYLDQKNPDTVVELFRKYESYSSDLLDEVQFVVVNDCSKLEFEIPDFNLNILWLNILDDIPWNQGGARNLGVTYARSDKVLLTDIDLEFPEQTLDYMRRARNPRILSIRSEAIRVVLYVMGTQMSFLCLEQGSLGFMVTMKSFQVGMVGKISVL